MNRLFALPVAALLTVAPQLKAAGCDGLIATMLKIGQTNAHLYSTGTGVNGGVTKAETIYLNNAIYTMVHGRWRKSPLTAKEMTDSKDTDSAKRGTCSVVRDEAVNGEAATLYKTQTKTDTETVDTQVWISKSKGLPLKEINDIDVGGGPGGKSHTETRFEYTNVTAPPIQ